MAARRARKIYRSQADAARALGINRRTLSTWLREGAPRRKDGYDVERLKAWRAEKDAELAAARKAQSLGERSDTVGTLGSSNTDSRESQDWGAKFRQVRTMKAKLELDIALGKVVPIEEVEDVLVARAIEFRRDFEDIERALPAQMPMDAEDCARWLRDRFRRMLERYSRPHPKLQRKRKE